MYKYSKAVFVSRILSFILLFYVVRQYVPSVIPFFVPPLWVVFIISGVAYLHKKRVNAAAAFFGAFVAAMIVLVLPRLFFYFIPFRWADILYVRLSSISGILIGTAVLLCACTVLFFYTEYWCRYEPLMCIGLFVALFYTQNGGKLTVIPHTMYVSALGFCFMFLQIILLCSAFKKVKRFTFFAGLFFCLMLMVTGVITHFFNKVGVVNNGGLLEQKLFHFDFSDFLTLQDEVKMNSNLVMIVHVDNQYAYHLFRRMYLSGWDRKRGFYEKTAPNEHNQFLTLPSAPAVIPHRSFLYRETITQEIFTVNLDPSTFIALDTPVSVTPYTVWDTLSFKKAYKTKSEVFPALQPDIFSSEFPSGSPHEGLSKKDLEFYTAIDAETAALMKPIALSVTQQCGSYYDKIYALLEHFREGEYRYSLHPGKAPDGDQLHYFLTETKKGYCTYFAFSYCLMLRSIGIPARIAAGFFLHPETGIMNYYPVRANMAHAWVEVFFPDLGWISFDPTTQHLAEGESANFSFDGGGNQFNTLLSEILTKRNELRIQNEKNTASEKIDSFSAIFRRYFKTNAGKFSVFFIMLCLFAVLIFYWYPYGIIRFSKNNRKVIFMLKKKHPNSSTAFDALVQKAKFAPECTEADVCQAKVLFKTERKKRCKNTHHIMLCVFMIFPLWHLQAGDAEKMLENAETAIAAENWDTAAQILKDGIKAYPSNEMFQLKLGDLYYNNGLYELAYQWFTDGLKINRHNIKLLYGASNAAAALNNDETARAFLLDYLAYNPADIFGWATYGWLCFKTHKNEEGIQAMLNARSNYGDDGSISNALGNLYGELFDYPESKHSYEEGIKLALKNDSPYSASVYYYNKAILETGFYHFAEAEDDARSAVDYFSRSSGYLMLGELEERKNNFEQALYYYIEATKENKTPLPLINLAKMYLRAGYREHAERYLEEIKRVNDYSWIANFGMSTANFYAELYELYTKLYKIKYAAEKIRLSETIGEWFVQKKNLLQYYVLRQYYAARCSIAYIHLAKEYEEGIQNPSSELYRNSFYYRAFQGTPYKAQRYLKKAEAIETSFIPQAQASYSAEKGILQKDAHILEQALQMLDPVWEKELREGVLAALIECYRSSRKKTPLIQELFKSNPACFIEHSIKLPIRLRVRSSGKKAGIKTEKYLDSALTKTLFHVSETAFFVLSVNCGERIAIQLSDINGTSYYSEIFDDIDFKSGIDTKKKAVRCVNRLCKDLFQASLPQH